MHSDHDFQLHFVSQNQSFEVDFQQQENASSESLAINGRNYRLCGDESKILWLKTKLPELSRLGLTTEELKIHLQRLGATDIGIIQRVQSVATHSWAKEESPEKLGPRLSIPRLFISIFENGWRARRTCWMIQI